MPFIDFTTGQVLTADQMDLVMRQSVMRFADAATRDTALTGVLAEGMIAYLDDTDELLKYDGTDWVAIDPETITAQGDIIVGDAGGDASRLALGTAGQILESNGTTLSYVTPDASPNDIITTQGDLIIGDASGDAVRLPVGSADQVLTSDGTTVSFQNAASGGGYTLISSQTVTASTSVDFTSIPQTFKHLFLTIKSDTSTFFTFAVHDNLTNSDYAFYGVKGNASLFEGETINFGSGDRVTANLQIFDYATTDRFKGGLITVSREPGTASSSNFSGGLMSRGSADPITALTVDTSTSVNFTVELFGVS